MYGMLLRIWYDNSCVVLWWFFMMMMTCVCQMVHAFYSLLIILFFYLIHFSLNMYVMFIMLMLRCLDWCMDEEIHTLCDFVLTLFVIQLYGVCMYVCELVDDDMLVFSFSFFFSCIVVWYAGCMNSNPEWYNWCFARWWSGMVISKAIMEKMKIRCWWWMME